MSDVGEGRRQTARLWRVWSTVAQMLADRGYVISEDELNRSLDEFRTRCTDASGFPNMRFIAQPSPEMLEKYTPLPSRNDSEPQEARIGNIMVEFSGEPNVGIKALKDFQKTLNERKFYSGIYLTAANPTSTALKGIQALPIAMEVFKEEDLLVNITRHELVPKHILLSAAEKVALLQRYRLKETQLPRIRIDDPVAKYLGLRRGQVVKIIRKSETAGRYASYRWCI